MYLFSLLRTQEGGGEGGRQRGEREITDRKEEREGMGWTRMGKDVGGGGGGERWRGLGAVHARRLNRPLSKKLKLN